MPRRTEGSPLDWTYKEQLTLFLNTVDIAALLENGCAVESIGEGYFFTEKVPGAVLFESQTYWKDIKDAQDDAKARGAPHNPALREMAKLFLNSLSGKVIENLHLRQYTVVRNT